ncbi:MAG: riboflavin biosynthesis protein RibF [Aerococcus sp.]|nr:riboflavin biosynthesis protein RibF [Aerococcus sp.]
MKIITLHHPEISQAIPKTPIVLALGFFDGVHRGHQAVINRARREATKRELPLAVMTFSCSPRIIYQEAHPNSLQYLTTNEEKAQMMADLGVDILYFIEVTSAFATLSPQEFVDLYMAGFNAQAVVAGFDYTYGKKDVANMETLPTYSQGRFDIIRVPKLTSHHEKVGSHFIRQQIKEGQLDLANEALGYPYFFSGVVINGKHRGRELGYPTANVLPDANAVIPKVGVYTVECVLNHQIYWGMASIGYNITFSDQTEKTIEINLFDFNEQIYGEHLKVYWHQYLRDEMKFSSAEALVKQMEQDKKNALDYQANYEQDEYR